MLFESGAIVLHIAQHHPGLLPVDEGARAGAVTWMFAAIGTLDPPIIEQAMCALLERDPPWYVQRLAVLDRQVDTRLGQLSRWLRDADWLECAFSAGDLMTVHVLLRLRGSGLLYAHPNLLAYMARGRSAPRLSARLRCATRRLRSRHVARVSGAHLGRGGAEHRFLLECMRDASIGHRSTAARLRRREDRPVDGIAATAGIIGAPTKGEWP